MDKISDTFDVKTPREAAALRALDRAYREGVHARVHGMHTQNGRVSAWCGVDVATGYRVQVDAQGTFCECKGARAGFMCKHVAACADRAGMFDCLIENFYERAFGPAPDDPAPSATNVAVELATCPDCHGDGYGRIYTGGHFSDWIACDCHRCGNTGKVAIELAAA